MRFANLRSIRYLSVIGLVINTDTLMLMIPELLQVQRYVCTYRFSQDHLELLLNSIRASGGWNNNPSAGQYQGIFWRLMVRCGVVSHQAGWMWQHRMMQRLCLLSRCPLPKLRTNSLPRLITLQPSCVTTATFPRALVVLWTMLWSRSQGLWSGRRLSFDVCRASLVTDGVHASHDKSYHLLVFKNNGGLMITSEGTVKVVRAAERVICQVHSGQAPKVSVVMHVVREETGTEDLLFCSGNILDTHNLALTTTILTYLN